MLGLLRPSLLSHLKTSNFLRFSGRQEALLPQRRPLPHHLLLRRRPRRLGARRRPPHRLQARVPALPQAVHRLRDRQVQGKATHVVNRGERRLCCKFLLF